MLDFFAKLYEWFGVIPLYSKDLADHLKGFDITCLDYVGSPLYTYAGFSMVGLTVIFYFLQYYFINSPRFNKRRHWWVTAVTLFGVNFLIAFIMTYRDLRTGNYCSQLNISVGDCIGFGFSNAAWSFLFFLLITSPPFPRKLSGHNTTETTFWKPRS